jgi:3-mercaptopyruvate sulfurtransferase SseA
MSNNVTSVAAAASKEADAHFSRRLTLETDCWDVHDALSRGAADFVVLDVRGPDSYEAGHIPGAISLPHGKITENRMSDWPRRRRSSSIAPGRIVTGRTRPPSGWHAWGAR